MDMTKDTKIVAKIIKISTLDIQVEIQTEDGKDTLRDLKKLAEEVIDKYTKSKKCDIGW